MAMKWLVHSACHVLGYNNHPNNSSGDDYNFGTKKVEIISATNYNCNDNSCGGGRGGFQIPVHYPRYSKMDYEKMEESRLDMLLAQYGLKFNGTLQEKRDYAIGAFLWPTQY